MRVLKKSTAKQNLDSVLFAFLRKQHDFKEAVLIIECPLLANGSYRNKDKSPVNCVPPSYISSALCVF